MNGNRITQNVIRFVFKFDRMLTRNDKSKRKWQENTHFSRRISSIENSAVYRQITESTPFRFTFYWVVWKNMLYHIACEFLISGSIENDLVTPAKCNIFYVYILFRKKWMATGEQLNANVHTDIYDKSNFLEIAKPIKIRSKIIFNGT